MKLTPYLTMLISISFTILWCYIWVHPLKQKPDYQLDVHTKVDTIVVYDGKRIVGQIPLWDSSKISKLLYKDNE